MVGSGGKDAYLGKMRGYNGFFSVIFYLSAPCPLGQSQLCSTLKFHVGASPSGKAAAFDAAIRRFESCRPSQFFLRIANSVCQLHLSLSFHSLTCHIHN